MSEIKTYKLTPKELEKYKDKIPTTEAHRPHADYKMGASNKRDTRRIDKKKSDEFREEEEL